MGFMSRRVQGDLAASRNSSKPGHRDGRFRDTLPNSASRAAHCRPPGESIAPRRKGHMPGDWIDRAVSQIVNQLAQKDRTLQKTSMSERWKRDRPEDNTDEAVEELRVVAVSVRTSHRRRAPSGRLWRMVCEPRSGPPRTTELP